MAANKVLVLDADGRAGVACMQSLGRTGNEVHIGVRKLGSTAERSRWCHRAHAQPAPEPVDVAVDWLVELDRRHGFTLVLATTEASLRWLRAMPEGHPVRAKAILPSDAALDAALDKAVTTAIALELGLPVPASRHWPGGLEAPAEPTATLRAAAGPPTRYPVVLKPVRSKVVMGRRLVSLSVSIAHDASARDATLASWLPYTSVQEQVWVPGRGVGVEVLYEGGRMVWHFVHERLHEWPLTGGASTLRRAGSDDAALVEMTRQLLDRLGWHGVAMVEWRRAADGSLHLMEINPRLWGSLPLTIAAGVDVPQGLLSIALGRPVPPARGWRVGVTARNLTDDIKWFIGNLRADRGDPMLLTEPPWRAALGWLRVLTGRESWDGWSWRDTRVARAEVAALLSHRMQTVVDRIERRAAVSRARKRHRFLLGAPPATLGATPSVLFLCLGNICRSPFAAAAARARLAGVHVDSAGFLRHDGRPSPPHIIAAAESMGFDLTAAQARRLTADQVAAASLVVCMDVAHLSLMAVEFPEAMDKTTLLGLFEPEGPVEIRDPYDMSIDDTRTIFRQMLRAIDGLARSPVLPRA